MIDENDLRQIILDSSAFNVDKQIARSRYFDWLVSSCENDFIKVISGFRRVGKSFLLKQLREYLIKEKNIPPENIFFINFEHDIINFNNVFGLRKLWDLYNNTLATQDKPIYLFLDEIQNIKAWEKFVRTLYDSSKNKLQFFLTGSNSAMLSGEFSTALGGRTVELKVYPFDFKEFLLLKNIEIKNGFDKTTQKHILMKNLLQYLKYGGLPETINKNKHDIYLYLKNVFNKVLLDDVVKRFEVRNFFVIEKLLLYLFSNAGDIISFSKIAHILKEGGENISSPTLYEYANMYEQAFAIKRVPKFDWKKKNIFRKQYKFYAIDNGFISIFNNRNVDEKLLENLVFNFLSRKYSEIFYGRNEQGKEIDFIIPKSNKEFLKIQASLFFGERNKKRELGNFASINKYLKKGDNILITLNGKKQTHHYRNTTIKELPLLDFVLDFEKKYEKLYTKNINNNRHL